MASAAAIDERPTLPHGDAERVSEPPAGEDTSPGPGVTLGSKYLLLREIGSGGVGSVYAAENTWTGRHVALKVLRPEYARVPDVVSRFWHEARVASSLRHPNIVDVLDVGIDAPSGASFIVEELLEGEDLDALLERSPNRRLGPEEALRVLAPVMDALAACHERGIVHRDVKPSNILLCRAPDGAVVPKLLDFGVARSRLRARQSSAGLLFGTPQYMSPEQARGEPDLDARTDIWAMGVTLFEALAGRGPFEGDDTATVLARVQRATPPPLRDVAPDVPAHLADAVDRALRPRREDRPPTMRAFLDALHHREPEPPPESLAATAAEPAPAPARRRDVRPTRLLLTAALTLVALFAGTFLLTVRATRPEPRRANVARIAAPATPASARLAPTGAPPPPADVLPAAPPPGPSPSSGGRPPTTTVARDTGAPRTPRSPSRRHAHGGPSTPSALGLLVNPYEPRRADARPQPYPLFEHQDPYR